MNDYVNVFSVLIKFDLVHEAAKSEGEDEAVKRSGGLST